MYSSAPPCMTASQKSQSQKGLIMEFDKKLSNLVFVMAHSCYFSSMQNSERGKKIGNAVMSTSRSVVQTGKAVGKINIRFISSLVNSFLFHIEHMSHTVCFSSTKQPHCACST